MNAEQKKPFAEREITITRVFDAPRALVFAAWTDAKHLAQWWGLQGFTNPIANLTRGLAVQSAFICARQMARSIR